MVYLLDTNIVSDLLRNPYGAASLRLKEAESEAGTVVITSIVVACEARFGILRKGSPRLEERVEGVLSRLSILPLAEGADRHYATLRLQLERDGTPIGTNDMLIAAHALALDAVLVTDNVREFSRVKSLRWENWLSA